MTKPNINEIIKSARKAKGFTQQELADEAGISLRTVQRIEKGIDEISGFSLKQISKILEIPLENLIMQNVNQISIDSNQIGSVKILYISSLLFIIFPFLGFIVPAIVGFTKENRNAFYKKHLRFILLLQGIQSLIILCLFFFILPIVLIIPSTETPPQVINIEMPVLENTSELENKNISLIQQDSIYTIKNFSTIDSNKRNEVLKQKLLSVSTDSIRFSAEDFEKIASIIGLKKDKSPNLNNQELSKKRFGEKKPIETNWFITTLVIFTALYYIVNIGIVVFQIYKLKAKKATNEN